MTTTQTTCDSCGIPLGDGRRPTTYLTLAPATSGGLCRGPGVPTLVSSTFVPPSLDREYHFCSRACLAVWASKGGAA